LWSMQSRGGENLFTRHLPSSCFEESHCRSTHEFNSHHFESVESWSNFYSSRFGLGVGGGYQGFRGSVDSSLGSTTSSGGQEARSLSYAVQTSQRKCYRLIRDQHCAYNQSNLQPTFLERLDTLPTGSPYTEEKMELWQSGFIQRFGTHIAMESRHGSLVHALISAESRSEMSEACMDSSMRFSFGWVAPVVGNLSGTSAEANTSSSTSSCDGQNASSSLESSSCIALGGDPALQSQVCQPGVTRQTLDAWIAGGDLQDGSSAYQYSFMPIADFLTNVDVDKYYETAHTLEKAVEYSQCSASSAEGWVWEQSSCKCARQCQNGGELDEETCTCRCRGDERHGWRGPNCEETYGSCQPGPGTGNPGAARMCAVNNQCSSWFRQKTCQDTELCCATNFGTRCCPYGSRCSCWTDYCSCQED